MRLAKYIAHAGVASRRGAEDLVRSGRVTVGAGIVTDPARAVDEADVVALDGTRVLAPRDHVLYALNKPMGVVSTARDPQGRPTVVGLLSAPTRLFPVGRLDIDTTGLILLTNDGELANRLMHPRFEVQKTYRALVSNLPVRRAALEALRGGLLLDDGPTAPAMVRVIAPDELELTIREGRKRQVKRMCEQVGHPVRRLERTRFGPIELGDLRLGEFRLLAKEEVALLRSAGPGS